MGKILVDVQDLEVDFLSIVGHKVCVVVAYDIINCQKRSERL